MINKIKGVANGEKHNSLDYAIHFFCFISVLFIGADKWGINVGVNLRLDQIFLVILTLLLAVKNAFMLTENKWIILFAVFTFISAVFAFNFFRGVIFYFSIIYNIVFVFYCFESYVRVYGIFRFIKILRLTFYVQFFILAVQFVLKVMFNFEFSFLPAYGEYLGIPRFNLWFYEPSYLASYVVFWFALAAYMLVLKEDGSYIFDIFISAITLVVSTSTTGFLGIALVIVLVYIAWLFRGITFKKIIILLAIIAAIIAFRFIFSSLFDTFIARIFTSGIDSASGGRVSQWKETAEVFFKKPFFGVGPGNYGLYVSGDASYVPSNVTLELLATTGIFSTVAFYGISFSLATKTIKLKKGASTKQTGILIACVFALFIFTVVLQANQGYLRLYHWMFAGFISGGIQYVRRASVDK